MDDKEQREQQEREWNSFALKAGPLALIAIVAHTMVFDTSHDSCPRWFYFFSVVLCSYITKLVLDLLLHDRDSANPDTRMLYSLFCPLWVLIASVMAVFCLPHAIMDFFRRRKNCWKN